MKHDTLEHLTPEERYAILTNYENEARRLRSEAFKTFFSEGFRAVRNMFKSTFAQDHKLAHASE